MSTLSIRWPYLLRGIVLGSWLEAVVFDEETSVNSGSVSGLLVWLVGLAWLLFVTDFVADAWMGMGPLVLVEAVVVFVEVRVNMAFAGFGDGVIAGFRAAAADFQGAQTGGLTLTSRKISGNLVTL